MTTVVTGAAGHVGGNLIRELIKEGRTVRALVRSDAKAVEDTGAEIVNGDITDLDSLMKAFEGADVVYNLAAKISIVGDKDGSVHNTNVIGARNVVEACLACGVKRLVHFSSTHALRQRPYRNPVTEDSERVQPDNAGAYDNSKANGEKEVLKGVERGLDAVICNPSAILGPNDFKPSRMGEVICRLARKQLPGLVKGGYNWVDVRDVVEGAILAEKKGKTGESYLLTGDWLSMKDLALVVEKITGAKSPSMVVPMWVARIAVPFSLFFAWITRNEPLFTNDALDALKCNRNILNEKAKKELGYTTRPIEETVKDTIEWFTQQNLLAE